MEALRMKGIIKDFGSTRALDQADLVVKKGEIHSLLGENGAGKTTLMKILYGMYEPNQGEIFINGNKVVINSPKEAMNLGINMVFQHFMLIPNLSVTENIILGQEETKLGVLSYKEARKKVMQLSEQLGLKVRPDMRVADIPVGEKQRVEILKALYRGADLLILDEPTAVLTPQEVKELFKVLKALKENGKTIIIITHKLKETMAVADNVTVLRNGKTQGIIAASEATPEILAQMMVGRSVILEAVKEDVNKGRVLLETKDLTLGKKLKKINLQVQQGQILGIAGVEGNGQTELLETLLGLETATSGSIYLNNTDVTQKAVKERLKIGLGFIAEDRNDRGLVNGFSIWQNSVLGYQDRYQKNGILNMQKIYVASRQIVSNYQVKVENIFSKTSSLSGGNAQKLLVGRVFYHDPEVLIIAHPTRGVDVGAIEYLHNEILQLRKKGKAILLVSADLDEVRQLSDRIAVLYEGKIVMEGNTSDFTEEALGIYMAGGDLVNREVVLS